MSSSNEHPTFGAVPAGVECTVRRAAYAVVIEPGGHVAAVRGSAGLFLPGGGSLPDESPEATVLREVREECGCAARLIRQLGEATQYFMAENRWYRMRATFYLAQFDDVPGSGEHELVWLSPEEVTRFYHECHSWAVARARDTMNGPRTP